VVPDAWATGRQAVAAFERFCTDHKWVFTELPGQADFGKDGYVDFSNGDRLTGQCIAVQIKGGRSFRRKDGYAVTADSRRRRLWANSTVPVFGIVWDPGNDSLFWINLTKKLRQEGLGTPLLVESNHHLADSLDEFIGEVWQSTSGTDLAAALGSDDVELQDIAIEDCWGLARRDPRFLVLVRRSMFGMQPEALDRAIFVLNSCSLNMDNFYDTKWMSMDNRHGVRQTFLWTVDEAVALLDRTQDEDGFERGSFSSCIYWLLVGPDPQGDHFVSLVEAATLRAAGAGRMHAAAWGLVLRVYWAGSGGASVLDRLLDEEPALASTKMTAEVKRHLDEHGHLSL